MNKNSNKRSLLFGLFLCIATSVGLHGMEPVDMSAEEIEGKSKFALDFSETLLLLQDHVKDEDSFYDELVATYFDALDNEKLQSSSVYKERRSIKNSPSGKVFKDGKSYVVTSFFYAVLLNIAQNETMRSFFSDEASGQGRCAACIERMKQLSKTKDYKSSFEDADLMQYFVVCLSKAGRKSVASENALKKDSTRRVTSLVGGRVELTAQEARGVLEALDEISELKREFPVLKRDFATLDSHVKEEIAEKVVSLPSYRRSLLLSIIGVEGLLWLMVTAGQLDAESVHGQWMKQAACVGVCSLVVEMPKVLWRWKIRAACDRACSCVVEGPKKLWRWITKQ